VRLRIEAGSGYEILTRLARKSKGRCVAGGLVCLLMVAAAGCRSSPARAPAIGEAFAGPAMLNLREEISLRSRTVATVKHGERLEILQRRRRFLLVRTPQGQEGWTDERQLLSTAQMDALRQLGERAARMASHGQATVFDVLNVHTEPHRLAPSFCQLKEGDYVDVVGHRLTPRTGIPPSGVGAGRRAAPAVKPRRSSSARNKPAGKFPPPPMPAPPPLPPDWLELSRTRLPGPAVSSRPVSKTPSPVVMEDWSLVRTRDGRAGWVLTRNLRMAIPDEVAQYAEGHRITS